MRRVLIVLFMVISLFGDDALDLINSYRNKAGLNSLKKNTLLTYASEKHSEYMFHNKMAGHYEDENYPYFFGTTPSKRVLKAGYPSRFIVENVSYGQDDYQSSIKNLFSAIYHRLGFLDFNIDEIGYAQSGEYFTYNMGNSLISKACESETEPRSGLYGVCKEYRKVIAKSVYYKLFNENPEVVLWPYNGMRDVPAVFYEEHPDPLPNYGVSGYPISVSFNPFYVQYAKLIYFKLYRNYQIVNNVKIISKENDINHLLKKTDFVLFPLDRLEYGNYYQVEAKFYVDGKYKLFKWGFWVEKRNNLITFNKSKASIYENREYNLYFPPQHNFDKIQNFRYQYPADMKIEKIGFKDSNTLFIRVKGKGAIKLFINGKIYILQVK
jgi:hypothetical protein